MDTEKLDPDCNFSSLSMSRIPIRDIGAWILTLNLSKNKIANLTGIEYGINISKVRILFSIFQNLANKFSLTLIDFNITPIVFSFPFYIAKLKSQSIRTSKWS